MIIENILDFRILCIRSKQIVLDALNILDLKILDVINSFEVNSFHQISYNDIITYPKSDCQMKTYQNLCKT